LASRNSKCYGASAGGGPAEGLDQTTLAKKLACSPAQISATVERMRSRGWIEARQTPGDRRRNLWQRTTSGNRLLEQMLAAASQLPKCAADQILGSGHSGHAGEVAA
jgi:DNA-binding MarR family transcriptional regulator